MKRFILSAFSVLLATAAVAPTAQALPKLDSEFNMQTLRLSEFDIRNKSEETSEPYYYPETSIQSSPQSDTVEQDSAQTTEPTVWEASETEEEETSPALSLTERRQEFLDNRI